MKFEYLVQKGIKDIGPNNLIKNESILEALEDTGDAHSNSVGYGALDLDKTNISWVLLEWKIQVLKRPLYNEKLQVETWGRDFKRAATYRDFSVYNDKKELLIIGTSKWAMINSINHKILRITDEIYNKYKPEDELKVFGEEEIEKIDIPELYSNEYTYKIEKKDIDINNHFHNTLYLSLAYEALPVEVYNEREFDYFRITYKKEIVYGDVVKCKYAEVNNNHIVVLYNETKETMAAIIELRKTK